LVGDTVSPNQPLFEMAPNFKCGFYRASMRCLLLAAFLQCVAAIILALCRTDPKRWMAKINKQNDGINCKVPFLAYVPDACL
jgi:hypothetical protein